MDRQEFLDIIYTEFESDSDNIRANRIIDAADEYAESARLAEVTTNCLKPCRCGGHPQAVVDETETKFGVKCFDCGASIYPEKETLEEAIEAWNKVMGASRLDDVIGNIAYILDALRAYRDIEKSGGCNECGKRPACEYAPKLGQLVRYQPEYKPVTLDDFPKTMSASDIHNFWERNSGALKQMQKMGFVVCKKTTSGIESAHKEEQ